MKRTIGEVTLTVLAIASGSCLISLMALFMGGGQGGTDLRGLMYLQGGVSPIAFAIAASCAYGFIRTQGWSAGLRAAWRAIPQWLVFIFLILNSLVISGEAAYLIVMQATNEPVTWHQHIPLVCLLICSTAFLLLHARMNSYPGSPPAMSGRWM